MDNGSSEKVKPSAVVLGVEHPRSVAVVRSLGKAGIPVTAIDYNPLARGFYSRYAKEKHVVDIDYDRTLSFLESLGQSKDRVLIPTNDLYMIFVAKNFHRLSQSFTMTSPPWDVLEKVMDKPESYRIAEKAGLKAPRFFTPSDIEETKGVIADLDFDNHAYILKTRLWSSGPADAHTKRFSRDAGPDASSVEANCMEIFSRLGVFPMIEEVVPGDADRCIRVSMVVDRDHEPVISYCIRRLRLQLYSKNKRFVHPYELGAQVFSESVHDEEAVEAAKRFVRKANYFGMITVEFRRDSTDETLTFIKADPRPVRATSLSASLGLDTPTTLYDVFTNGKTQHKPKYPDGVAWMWFTWYFKALWSNRRQIPMRSELITLLSNAPRIKAFAYLSLTDPLPFLIEIPRRVEKLVSPGQRDSDYV